MQVKFNEVLPITLVGTGILTLGLSGVLKSEPEVAHACNYPTVDVVSSVYRVQMNGRTGGSAVLTADGWFTAAHVLTAGADLEVAPEVGEPWDSWVIYSTQVDPKSDAGSFRSTRMDRSALRWRLDGPVRGERVWAIGYPLGKELTVTTGHVHGLTTENQWLYHSAPAMSGMSGGAVVTCDKQRGWEVVGITAAIALVPQRTPMGIIGNPVPFMSYASTVKQNMDNVEAHNWGSTPW